MSELLSCEEIWAGVVHIEHVVLTLDYSIWLEIECDGLDDDAKVEIVQGVQREYEAAVTDYCTKHREDLALKYLKCPRCGEIGWESDLDVCPRAVYRPDLCPPRYELCASALKVVRYNDDDPYLRERAGCALARIGAFVSTKHLIAGRIASRALGRDWSPSDTGCRVVLAKLRRHLADELSELNDRITAGISLPDPVRLLRRRNLYPHGADLAAKYADYLCIRDKFINCYHWLDGQTANHPSFIERGEESRGIRLFSQPVLPPFKQREASDLPHWDSVLRELRFRERLCKRYRKSSAPNQTSVLEAFQAANWVRRVDNVADDDGMVLADRRLLETIRGLKKGLKYITFYAVGTGRSVVWELARPVRSSRR